VCLSLTWKFFLVERNRNRRKVSIWVADKSIEWHWLGLLFRPDLSCLMNFCCAVYSHVQTYFDKVVSNRKAFLKIRLEFWWRIVEHFARHGSDLVLKVTSEWDSHLWAMISSKGAFSRFVAEFSSKPKMKVHYK